MMNRNNTMGHMGIEACGENMEPRRSKNPYGECQLISKLPEYAGRPKRRIDTYGNDCYIQLSGGILEMGYDIVRHKLLIWACSSRASGVDAPVDDLSTIQSIIMNWCKQWHIGMEDLV